MSFQKYPNSLKITRSGHCPSTTYEAIVHFLQIVIWRIDLRPIVVASLQHWHLFEAGPLWVLRVNGIKTDFVDDDPWPKVIKLYSFHRRQRGKIIEIRLGCRCLQKCFLIWNYYVCCLWAPLLVLTQSKETVFDQFFYNKRKILTILFILKYEKITLFDEFLVLLGPCPRANNQQVFSCSNEGKKIIKNNKGCLL